MKAWSKTIASGIALNAKNVRVGETGTAGHAISVSGGNLRLRNYQNERNFQFCFVTSYSNLVVTSSFQLKVVFLFFFRYLRHHY